MLILHAGYSSGSLYFWGENAEEGEGKAKGKATKPPRLPFGASGHDVKAIIAEILYDRSVREEDTTPLLAWLPTTNKTAVSSSPLISEPPTGEPKFELNAWQVDAVQLNEENTISFLSACVNKEVLKSGIVLGHDLLYWTQAIRFAGALVARQEYLPDLISDNGNFRAIWDPIFLGSDGMYLEQLAHCMPGACRGVSIDLKEAKPQTSAPGSMLSTFIVDTVDYIARHAVYTQPQATWFKEDTTPESFNNIHDHWLQALVDYTSEVVDDPKECNELQEQIQEWRRPISASIASPFRLYLRLEEPAARKKGARAGSETWYVHFFLQSTYQPDILIPADHVWKPTAEEAKILSTSGFEAKEFFLSSLGIASTICPRIENSLKTEAPDGYELDTDGAFEFLTQRSIALKQAGFGVETPGWWSPSGTRQKLATRARIDTPKRSSKNKTFSLSDVLDFRWEITLEGEKVTREELKELAKSKRPLVQMRGHWIHVEEEDLNTALDMESQKKKNTGTLRDIVQMALGSAAIPGDFAFDGVSATGWVDDFIRKLEGDESFEELVVPGGFQGTLRAYQTRGFSWLSFLQQWGLGACLADDMGLGKTIQALTLIQYNWEQGNKLPTLIICPTSLTGNWQKESERFVPDLPTMVHHGINRRKGDAFIKQASEHAIVISSYSLLHRDLEVLKKIDWHGVILDEAQNIKNPKTKQARSARQLAGAYRVAMTGTPIENNVGDLWSIMEFLNPGFLGNQAEFKRRFLLPIQANHESGAVEKLRTLTGPFILRRLKNDKTIIKDLPGKMEMKVYCTLTKEQAALYEALVREVENALETTEGIQRRGLVLATLTKLKQICNHPAHFEQDNSSLADRSGKLNRLTEMLEEVIAIGDRALVFTQFAEMGKLIQKHLQETFGHEVLFLYGSVPKKQRDEMIERFQDEEDGPKIFVLSLKAGGTGLNLMRANHVFHFDRWWNPAVEDQATDRVYRIGQKKNVQIHKFLCAGTLEEKIDDMLEQKKGIAEKIVGAGENWLTELTTAELKRLFELKEDAIAE